MSDRCGRRCDPRLPWQGQLRRQAVASCSPPPAVRATAGGARLPVRVHSRACKSANNVHRAKSARRAERFRLAQRFRPKKSLARGRDGAERTYRPLSTQQTVGKVAQNVSRRRSPPTEPRTLSELIITASQHRLSSVRRRYLLRNKSSCYHRRFGRTHRSWLQNR